MEIEIGEKYVIKRRNAMVVSTVIRKSFIPFHYICEWTVDYTPICGSSYKYITSKRVAKWNIYPIKYFLK